MEKVLKIIEKKMSINERLDKDDILSIIDEYVRANKLESFIKKVYFVNENDFDYTAFYNQEKLYLVFVMNKIYENAITNYNYVSNSININFNSFYNYYLLVSLFHELKHVMQYKKMFLGFKDNFLTIYNEDEILKNIYDDKKLYFTYHDLFPREREANIFSISETLKYFCMLKRGLVSKEELKYYQLHYVNTLLSGYDRNLFNIKSPFEKLVKLGNVNKLMQIDDINEVYLTLYNRVLLGLPISKKEYDRIFQLYYLIKDERISPSVDIEKIIVKRG